MRLWRRKRPLTLEEVLPCVRSGLSLDDWRSLDPTMRLAFERAGTMVRAEFALAVAIASGSPEGALSVASEIDGGASEADALMDAALDKAVSMLGVKR